MARLYITALLLLFSLNAFSRQTIEFVYAGLRFSVPGNFTALGDAGGEQNILVFRYGDVRGKNFLAFADMTEDVTSDYGCSANVFFYSVFSGKKISECNQELIKAMRETLVAGKKIENWSTNDYAINYSADDDKAFVFISGENGKLIKIDSDFMGLDAFKKMLKGL